MYHGKNSQNDDQGGFDSVDSDLGFDNAADAESSKTAKRRYEGWRLGNRLLSYRMFRGITQAQLAAKVDVSRITISRIETCQQQPTMGLALVIAEALDEPVDRLFYLRRPTFNMYQ